MTSFPTIVLIGLFAVLMLLLPAMSVRADEPVAYESKGQWQRHIPPIPVGVTPIEDLPTSPRQHVQTITANRFEYAVDMGGTMDGPSTRMPRGYAAWNQVFQPMQFVRIENTGDSDVVNPRLSVNGKRQWWTDQDFIDSAYRAYGNPTSDAEKVRAIYEYYVNHMFHASASSSENDDAIKALHIFGHALCNNDGWILSHIYDVAGFPVRGGRPVGHVVIEVFHDDRWHLLDADQSMFFLLPDNQTIASNDEIAHDHDLVKRTHSYSINFPEDRARDEAAASVYHLQSTGGPAPRSRTSHTMDMTLRPGEVLEWRFERRPGEYDPVIRRRTSYSHGPDIGSTQGASAGNIVYTGKWIYSPPLHLAAARRVHAEQNVVWSSSSNQPALRAGGAGQLAYAVWRVAAPYVMVGGSVHADTTFAGDDESELAVSFDEGETWTAVDTWTAGEAPGEMTANLDRLFPPQLPGMPRHLAARYDYLLRLTLPATNVRRAGVSAITIRNDLQMAPLSLPELELGENSVTYSDSSSGERSVEVTFDWVESSATRPPAASAAPRFPQDGAEVEGTQVVFRWEPAIDPDGDGIADYHFQLSDRADMLWPLSPNFHKLSTNTRDETLNEFTTPYEGLLNGGQRYYWRVQALNDKGVWGPWSETWSFVPQAPGVPLDVTVAADDDDAVTLQWRANPAGRRPAGYEIHASNERGFTVSREPHVVQAGGSEASLFGDESQVTFEPSLLKTVTGTTVTLRPAHAHYRIVAMDEKGNRSGGSDFVTVPRPLIYTAPSREAKVGERYVYEVVSVASIGDMRSTRDGRGFWNAEQSTLALKAGPDWLTLDVETGVLSGVPTRAGRVEVRIEAKIDGIERRHEQAFVIDVRP